MARSIGKVTINFGLVSIPVKLYASGDGSSRIGFNLMSPKGNRLKQQYIDVHDGDKVIPHGDQLKGYEFAKGQYVTFTQAEIKSLQEQPDPVISIASFAPNDIPVQHLDKAYYLAPEKGGEKAYELLRSAMQDMGVVGLTKHISHGKQHLAMIVAAPEGLILQHLLYNDEVVKFSTVHEPAPVKIMPMELAMAKQLITMAMVDKADLSTQVDEVKQRVELAIQAKIEGKLLAAPEPAPAKPVIVDLMAALKASIEKGSPTR